MKTNIQKRAMGVLNIQIEIKHKCLISVGLIVLFVGLASCKGQNNKVGKNSQWALIWQDEFSKDGAPDPTKWSSTGRGTLPWMCYCIDDPATAIVNNGKLFLTGIVFHAATYTLPMIGCIETRHKISFGYGKMAACAKAPMVEDVEGFCPAIWLMPEKVFMRRGQKRGNRYLGTSEGGYIFFPDNA